MLPRIILLFFISTLIVTSTAQCVSASTSIDYMVTGVMELGNPLQSYAQTDYNVVFSSNQKLGNYGNLFFAFAIVGLGTASGQNFYSVSVDKVFFSNSNTVMKVIMDYTDVSGTQRTQWNKIKLSYIVVSPQFQGISTGGFQGNSYVYASTLQLTPPLNNAAADLNALFAHSNQVGMCGYIGSFPLIFGTNCPADAKILYHYYIMGFKYNSTGDSVFEFRASIISGDGSTTNENDFQAVIAPAITPNGPKFTIDSFSNQLQKIKIGYVLTVLRDYNNYPTQPSNPQTFKYSGIFMPVTTFNSNMAILNSSLYNRNHFDLTYSQYKFYGFSRLFVQPNFVQVDFSLDVKDIYTLSLSTINTLTNVLVSADVFTKQISTGACTSILTQRTQIRSEQYSAVPSLTAGRQTLNKISASNGILVDAVNQYVFDVYGYDVGTDNDLITYTIQLTYENLKPGYSYVIQTSFNQLLPADLPSGWSVQYSLSLDNKLIFTDTIVADNTQNDKINKLGRTISNSAATFTLTIVFARNPSQDIRFQLNFALLQVSNVFDTVNLCCNNQCPPNTALSLQSNPYRCVPCNTANGQIYNSVTNQCDCVPGYYIASTINQLCSPCPGNLCATCGPSTPSRCLSCVDGAQQILLGYCTCKSGYTQTDNKCILNGTPSPGCNYKCASCSSTNTCLSCVDPNRRILSNSCNCIEGYFDNGQANCLACSLNCKTCTSVLTQCNSCYQNQNKFLQGNQCVCNKGYYSTSDALGNIKCQKCALQCDQCSGNPWTCVLCNSTKNKVPGYDNVGRLTCVCASGYLLDSTGSCIQSDCTLDPNCVQCSASGNLKICTFCKPNLNRYLDTNTYKCVCQDGYYQTAAGLCVACSSACSSCKNSTFCNTCVAGATKTSQNLCRCQNGTFFTETPTRYCKNCQQNCQFCDQSGNCAICVSPYTKTSDGKCVCGFGMVINQNGVCSACSAQCLTCQQVTKCLTCKSNMLLQQNKCVSRCSLGFFKSGLQCLSCPIGCNLCSQANTCVICQNGYNILAGKCYQNCPSGSVLQPSTSQCVACNYPCRTCTQHPSKCTSCQSDAGALVDFTCTITCPAGSYASGGLCQYCDFSCASCLGSARMCTSCPAGKFLYNGACYDYCPQFNINGLCITSCPSGFYQTSSSSCAACPSICQQCKNSTQCTVCSSTTFSYLGQCLNQCPSGTYSVQKQCAQCDVSCKTCTNLPTTCLQCANGYVFSSSNSRNCIRRSSNPICSSSQFLNTSTNQCQQCSKDCQTCSNATNCLSCYQNSIPVNGKCRLCPFNCDQCTSTTQCSVCSNGFFLNNKQCVSACPYPLVARNGICQCTSGIVHLGNCVSSCPIGFTAVSSQCLKCNSNCKQCSQKIQFCTSCYAGFELNIGNKKCQQVSSITCPYGQYEQSGKCIRFCSTNLVYLSGLCYFTCIDGYENNNQGGCIVKNSQGGSTNPGGSTGSQCSSSQWSFNGSCVNICPQFFYPNIVTRKCQSCPSNCINCVSSTSCNICANGYEKQLGSGSCILISNNNNNNNNSTNPSCSSGFYYNTTFKVCFPCQNPCKTCSDFSVCTSCIDNYAIVLGQCVQQFTNCQSGSFRDAASNTCRSCVSPCATCISATSCNSCISGYQLNGQTCTPNIVQNLIELSGIQIEASYRRGNSVIVSVLLPAIPSLLTSDQENRFFSIKQSNLVNTILSVNQWQSSLNEKRMFVSVNYASIQGSAFLFLSVNSVYLGQSYASLGYSINDKAYKAVSVYQTMPEAPNTIQIPADSQAIPYTN